MTAERDIEAELEAMGIDPAEAAERGEEWLREQLDTNRGKACRTLREAGWILHGGRWWRDGVWATARGGIIDVKGKLSADEARAFVTLALVQVGQ